MYFVRTSDVTLSALLLFGVFHKFQPWLYDEGVDVLSQWPLEVLRSKSPNAAYKTVHFPEFTAV